MSNLLYMVVTDRDFVLVLVWFYWAGKAVYHTTVVADPEQAWASKPALRGLQITDARHLGSFLSWGPAFWATWAVIGLDPWAWVACSCSWAVPWIAMKHLTGKLKRWYVLWPFVIYEWVRTKGWRK